MAHEVGHLVVYGVTILLLIVELLLNIIREL